jgi:phosphoglycerol transferase
MAKKKRNKSGNPAAGSTQTVPGFTPTTSVAQSTYSVAGSSSTPSTSFVSSQYFEWLVLAVASAISYWILTARLVGVNVSVLVDEYSYVLDAHYKGSAEATYPNHLFQLVFSVTKQCGAEFYSCARSMNAVFVIAGAIFIYLLAKHISGKKWLGSLAAIASLLGSYGTYTAYFMPEAIFNFPMIAFYWALIRFGKTDNLVAWVGFGAILGIASLAKPHAFFVVPALVIFIFIWTRATKDKYLLSAILRIGALGLAAVGTKFGIGYLIAGERALSIFGYYGDLGSASVVATSTITQNAGFDVIGTGWGQTLMITMILGVALPVAILGFLELFKRDALVAEANQLRAVVGISLLNMMAAIAVFEAWQSLNTWMHTRYYGYLIPLAVVVLVEAYSRASVDAKPVLKRVVVGIFLSIALVALFTAAIPYGGNWIDAPDFRFHIDNLVFSSILICLSIALAIWWLWDVKRSMLVAVVVALVTSTFSGTHISNFLVASFGNDSTYDQLGRVLRNYLPQDELDKTVLVGDNQTNMERALFLALSGEARKIPAPSEGFDINQLKPSDRWLVKVGEPEILGLSSPIITGNGFSLYSLSSQNALNPRKNDLVSFSNQCRSAEDSAWSCGTSTSLTTSSEVLGNPQFDLIFEVSDTETGSQLEFSLGQTVLQGDFPTGTYALTLSFPGEAPGGLLEIRLVGESLNERPVDEKFLRVVSANVIKR